MELLGKSIEMSRKQYVTLAVIVSFWVFFLPLNAAVGYGQGSISIISPSDGETIGGTTRVQVSATVSTKLIVSSADKTQSKTYQESLIHDFSVDTKDFPDGLYTITALPLVDVTAKSDMITVTIKNSATPPPAANITQRPVSTTAAQAGQGRCEQCVGQSKVYCVSDNAGFAYSRPGAGTCYNAGQTLPNVPLICAYRADECNNLNLISDPASCDEYCQQRYSNPYSLNPTSGSYVYYQGICEDTTYRVNMPQISTVGGSQTVGPYPADRKYECSANERCMCYGYRTDFGTGILSVGVTSTVGGSSRSSPGTTPGGGELLYERTDPDRILNPTRFGSNEPDCSKISNATIQASVTPSLSKSGSRVEITGHVESVTNECKGVKYLCRDSFDIGCKAKRGFFESKIECKSCPSGTKQLYCEGEESGGIFSGILGQILGVVAMVAIAALVQAYMPQMFSGIGSLFGGGGAAGAGNAATMGAYQTGIPIGGFVVGNDITGMQVGTLQDFLERQDTGQTPDGTQAIPAVNIQSQPIQEPIKTVPSTTGTAKNSEVEKTFNRVGSNMARTLENTATQAVVGGLMASFYTSDQLTLDGCHSICGSDKWMDEYSASPTCPGGTSGGRVVGQQTGSYSCRPQSCGGYTAKEVVVEILDPEGKLLKRDSVTTDSRGDFTYTYIAPDLDATLTAKISVPNPRGA